MTLARDVASFNRPSNRDYRSVKSYFDEEAPLCSVESYIYRKEDIISLKPGRETAWLDTVIENILQKCGCGIIRVSYSAPLLMLANTNNTQYMFCSPVSEIASIPITLR